MYEEYLTNLVFIILERTKTKRKSADAQVEISKFYSIQPQYMSFKNKKTSSNSHNLSKSLDTSAEDQAIIDGFWLFYYETESANQYKPMSLLFHHPHSETCREWITQISAQIQCNLLDETGFFCLFKYFLKI